MRIRKNASKLLGSAAVYAHPCPPPPPLVAASAAAHELRGLVVCELNCSPWDLLPAPDPNSAACFPDFFQLVANPKDEDEGISGKSAVIVKEEPKEEEPILPAAVSVITCSNNAAGDDQQLSSKKPRIKEEKKKPGRKRKGKALVDSIVICRKTDGKGWHCKRNAQLPSLFCSYHLAQIRSYSANSSQRTAANRSAVLTNKSASTSKAVDRSADSGFYYYYGGFGPWRGKRRGGAATTAGIACSHNSDNSRVEEEQYEKSSSSSSSTGDEVNNDGGAIAGDDEYDLDDCFDDDNKDIKGKKCNNSIVSMNGDVERNGKEEKKKKKKKAAPKKRGRKPIKARSLMSLM